MRDTAFERIAAQERGRVSHVPTAVYLEGIGDPSLPADLARADFFAFDRTNVMIDGLRGLGVEVTRASFPILSENHLVQWEMCKQGIGICVVMDEVGDVEPKVRRVLPDLPGIPVPIWVTAHRELRTSRRIRVVDDLLADELAGG